MFLEKFFLLKLKLQHHSVEYNTNTFEVGLDNIENAKGIEEISLNSKEYLSILMLPLCFGNTDQSVKYYAISDTHQEYYGNNDWKLPNIYLDTETITNLNVENDINNVMNSITIWDSVEKLNELVGMDVEPFDGATCGVITSCYFLDGGDVDKNARWIVTYYDGNQIVANVFDTITYDAIEIGNIVLM